MRLLLVLIVSLGCWQPSPSVAAPAAPLDARPTPRSHHTVWEGRYECAQGVTGLRLVLDTAADGATTGTFEFYAVSENPGVPHGSYRMRGKLAMVEAGSFALDLAPDAWIEQPPGYVMVGLSVTSDRERRSMTGRITNASCGRVKVTRSD